MAETKNVHNVKKTKQSNTKIGAVIVLIISAVVFIPAGGMAVFSSLRQQKSPKFGSYNGKEILYEPGTEFYQKAADIHSMYGQYIGADQILQMAFSSTLSTMYSTDEVEKSGYSVPKSLVEDKIREAFTQDGVFNEGAYNTLKDSEYKKLMETTVSDLKASRFFSDLNGDENAKFNNAKLYGTKISSKEADFIASLGSEKHSFEIAAFSTDVYPEDKTIEYAQNNSEKFKKNNLSVLTFDDEKQAQEVLASLTDGTGNFEQALSSSTGFYGEEDGTLSNPYSFQFDSMIPEEEARNAVLALKKGEFSSVVKTSSGYSVFRCNEESETPDYSNEVVLSKIREYINSNDKSVVEEYFNSLAKDFRAESSGNFDSACEKFSVTKTEVPAFPLNYGNSTFYDVTSTVKELSGLSENSQALKTLFALKTGEISDVITLPSYVVVAKCTGIQNDEISTEGLNSKIENADSNSSYSKIMKSSRIEDNFYDGYFQLMMPASAK